MGLKVIVYGVKGDRLWGKSVKGIVYGEKVIVYGEKVYGVKGDRLRDEAKNIIRTLLYQHPEKTKIGFFSLKVIVYGKKGDVCIDTR